MRTIGTKSRRARPTTKIADRVAQFDDCIICEEGIAKGTKFGHSIPANADADALLRGPHLARPMAELEHDPEKWKPVFRIML
jgi:hypothetical protein